MTWREIREGGAGGHPPLTEITETATMAGAGALWMTGIVTGIVTRIVTGKTRIETGTETWIGETTGGTEDRDRQRV